MSSILYVDDEASFLQPSKRSLERDGTITVDTAESAEIALQKLKSNNYDAVISDYQMPGMDGIEFLKALRTSGDSTPFLLFTWKRREEVVIREVLSGMKRELEFRIQNPAGEIFYVHVSTRPEQRSGILTRIDGIMKDITSIKDLERLKVEALQQIEENLIEMAILNDQIRNPLAVIMAEADIAGGSTAEAIIRQVQEIDAMINTIDRKWIESVKVREFLQKYYGVKR